MTENSKPDRVELACYWLTCCINQGMVGLENFVSLCQGIENVLDASDEFIQKAKGLSPKLKDQLIHTKDPKRLEEDYLHLSSRGISFVGQKNPRFPARLLKIQRCPFGLFFIGNLPENEKLSIAIVGARSATPAGQEMARYFGKILAYNGIQVISGFAMGIDGNAHRGALEGSQKTWGVMGCGLNICYPKENIGLFETMKTHGGLLSEFTLDEQPLAWHFPYRNRIISGLSDGILVVEARQRSGSLITVQTGLDQGKDVFAIPGRPFDSLSAGCNSLIDEGAKLVTKPEDILEEYHLTNKKPPQRQLTLNSREKDVYEALCLDTKSIEQIARETGLGYAQTAKALTALTQKGLARSIGKNYYMIKQE